MFILCFYSHVLQIHFCTHIVYYK